MIRSPKRDPGTGTKVYILVFSCLVYLVTCDLNLRIFLLFGMYCTGGFTDRYVQHTGRSVGRILLVSHYPTDINVSADLT